MAISLKEYAKKLGESLYNKYYQNRLRTLLDRYTNLESDSWLLMNDYPSQREAFLREFVENILVYHAMTKEGLEVEVYEVDFTIGDPLTRKANLFWIKSSNIVTYFDGVVPIASVKKSLPELASVINGAEFQRAVLKRVSSSVSEKEDICYQEFLSLIYGEDTRVENLTGIIDSVDSKFKNLYNMKAEDFYNDNKNLFADLAFENILSNNTLNLSSAQFNEIKEYLLGTEQFCDIVKMLLTFNFTFASLKKYSQINFLDFSFVSVSLFKVVELVFNLLLNDFWKDKKIIDHFDNEIEFSNKKLELGKMKQFFYSSDLEITQHLGQKQQLVKSLKEVMGRWIAKTRNGFLHKDVLSIETLQKSITDSINILCLIILIIKR